MRLFVSVILFFGFVLPMHAQETKSALQFKVADIDGKKVDLSKYKNKVVLIVNVASECGYTPQYKTLQALHTKYAKDGLAILGFPSNDFGGQEPGTDAEVKAFATKKFAVTFDLFSKVKINGGEACDLYKYLTSKDANAKLAGAVRWNFEKFLIGRDGQLLARFASDVDPESDDFEKAIRDALKK